MVKAGAAVIDVGMNRTEEPALFGDVDPGAAERAAYLTPVPGGVGPMTIAMVLKNTVTAARGGGRQAACIPELTELDSGLFHHGRRLGARAVVLL